MARTVATRFLQRRVKLCHAKTCGTPQRNRDRNSCRMRIHPITPPYVLEEPLQGRLNIRCLRPAKKKPTEEAQPETINEGSTKEEHQARALF